MNVFAHVIKIEQWFKHFYSTGTVKRGCQHNDPDILLCFISNYTFWNVHEGQEMKLLIIAPRKTRNLILEMNLQYDNVGFKVPQLTVHPKKEKPLSKNNEKRFLSDFYLHRKSPNAKEKKSPKLQSSKENLCLKYRHTAHSEAFILFFARRVNSSSKRISRKRHKRW